MVKVHTQIKKTIHMLKLNEITLFFNDINKNLTKSIQIEKNQIPG